MSDDTTTERLEYLRGELRAERISYGELIELQGLAEHIDPGDVELLEAAGVPEHADDDPDYGEGDTDTEEDRRFAAKLAKQEADEQSNPLLKGRTSRAEEADDDTTYSIVRYRFKGENEVIRTGATLEEAQAHCERDDTHGDGWFDGWTAE